MIKELKNLQTNESLSKHLIQGVKDFEIKDGIALIKALSNKSLIVSSNIQHDKSLYDLNKSLERVLPSKLENISKEDAKVISSLSKSAIVGKYHTVVISDGSLLLGENQELYLLNYSENQDDVLITYYS